MFLKCVYQKKDEDYPQTDLYNMDNVIAVTLRREGDISQIKLIYEDIKLSAIFYYENYEQAASAYEQILNAIENKVCIFDFPLAGCYRIS